MISPRQHINRPAWIDELPSQWRAERLRFLADRIESGTSVNAIDAPAGPESVGVLKTSAVYTRSFRPEENKTVVEGEAAFVSCPLRVGALIVSRMNTPDLVGAAGLVKEAPPNLFLPDRLWQVELNREVCHPSFIHWYTNTKQYTDQIQVVCSGSSGSMQNLSQDKFRDFFAPLPAVDQQLAIASYLDAETARIDVLIAEKQRLIQLLEEQEALVAENVIAPTAHCREAKLAYFVDLLPGYAFPSDGFSANQADVRLLRGINIAPGAIRWDECVFWPAAETSAFERFRLREGDVVFGMDRPWVAGGVRVAMVDKESAGALLLQRVCRIRGESRMLNRFLYYALASNRFQQSIEFELSGVSVPHISPEQITRFRVPLLSVEEQSIRCLTADADLERIGKLIDHTRIMIETLLELRRATITDAVLGRIQVGP